VSPSTAEKHTKEIEMCGLRDPDLYFYILIGQNANYIDKQLKIYKIPLSKCALLANWPGPSRENQSQVPRICTGTSGKKNSHGSFNIAPHPPHIEASQLEYPRTNAFYQEFIHPTDGRVLSSLTSALERRRKTSLSV